jgi:hypothetical protein
MSSPAEETEPAAKRQCMQSVAADANANGASEPDPLLAAMPRTAGISDDTMIAVEQMGSGWSPQAVSMKNLRRTQSLFLDEAIDPDTHRLEIPAGTCQSQEDFVKLFSVYFYVSSVYLDQTRMLEVWDRLGFHKEVQKHLNNLEKRYSFAQRPDAITLYRWGRRFFRPILVQQACEAMLDADYKGPPPEPDMFPNLLTMARRVQKDMQLIRKEIGVFRETLTEMGECDPDCPKSCTGHSNEHPDCDWESTVEDDYTACAVMCVNSIAKLAGMED